MKLEDLSTIKQSDTREEINLGYKGLNVRVHHNRIVVSFRYQLNGVRRKQPLGEYLVGKIDEKIIKKIEVEYLKAVEKVGERIDIVGERLEREGKEKQKREERENQWSLETACAHFILNGLNGGEKHRIEQRGLIHNHILINKELARSPIRDIRWPDLQYGILDVVYDRETGEGHARTSDKVAGLLGRLFKHAMQVGKVDFSPATNFRLNGTNIRKRILTDEEIVLIWDHLDILEQSTADAIKIAFYLGCRIGEISIIRPGWIYREFNGYHDNDGNWLRIPAEHTKSGKMELARKGTITSAEDYWFFLSPSVKELLYRNNFELPPMFNIGRGFKKAVLSAGIEDKDLIADLKWDLRPRAHDIRRTFATRIEKQYDIFLAHRLLNHSKTGLSKVYPQHEYEDKKEEAFSWWERELNTILLGPDSNVVNFGSL